VALRTHEIDFYYSAPEQQYRELRTLEGITTMAIPSSQFEMLVFNGRRAPLDDVSVRRAVARAIDWVSLAHATYLDVNLADWGDIFPRSWAHTPQPDPNAYDPAQSRTLLDGAGWKPGPDGIRVKNGKRFELAITTVAG